MSLTFDRKAYGYNDLSRSILFDASDGETKIQFALPRVALADHLGQGELSDSAMWDAFHEAQFDIERAAESHWNAISAQHERDGTAPPIGTPLVLASFER